MRGVADVTDAKVQPTHGWRHRLKTIGRAVGIPKEYLDAMQGHEDGTVAARYGDMPVAALFREVQKLPRYVLGAGQAAED